MAFVSSLPNGTVIINSRNWSDHARPMGVTGVSTSGYMRRDRREHPTASAVGARRMPRELLIPREEWKERIEERERKGLRLYERLRAARVRWLNQSPSWYCWCYAVTHMCMAKLIAQNEPYRTLSPESVAGPIKNYRKQGGWGSQALAYIIKNGIADTNAWPWESHKQANNRRYFDGSRENAALTKADESWDLETLEEKVSCLLRDIPVASGYSHMGHEMCSIEPVWVNGQIGCIDLDSYARNGQFNTKTLVGRKMVGNDMVCVRSITPNSLPGTPFGAAA
jgi:hypothetical protein